MPILEGYTGSLAAVANATYNNPVPTGCEELHFLGNTLALSERNLLTPTSASLVASGAPVIATPSGATVGLTNGFLLPALEDTNETFMLVFQVAPTSPGGNNYLISNFLAALTDSLSILLSTTAPMLTSFVGFANSSGTAESVQVSPIITVAAPGTAFLAAPAFYVFKVDMVNMQITFKCMTPGAAAAGVGSPVTTIPAGYTRTPNTKQYRLGGYTNGSGLCDVHFLAKWNRVTTAAEDTAVYNAVQSTLAVRGITI